MDHFILAYLSRNPASRNKTCLDRFLSWAQAIHPGVRQEGDRCLGGCPVRGRLDLHVGSSFGVIYRRLHLGLGLQLRRSLSLMLDGA